MDYTSRMIRLLGTLRREMNGAVADGMYAYGHPYGLNYGVSLPTVRAIARDEGRDHDFARYLFKQQVRELRLAALHMADPLRIDVAEAAFWAEGIINSEAAEEAAFAMLSRSPYVKEIYGRWSGSDNELLAYAALMAAARGAAGDASVVGSVAEIVARYPSSRIIARGAVALLAAAYETDAARETAIGTVESLRAASQSFASRYVTDEMSWRME